MKVKTSELRDTPLAWAVAKILQLKIDDTEKGILFYEGEPFLPDTYWHQAGPIIEQEKIGVWWATHVVDDEGTEYGNHWYAEPGMTDENADKSYTCMTGPTMLIAAMRCYVASKLGAEVEIPEELI